MLEGKEGKKRKKGWRVLCVSDGPGICRGASEGVSPNVSQG